MLSPILLFSQGEWNQWRFGQFAGLDFNAIPPVSISGSAMQTTSQFPVSVSDSLGNLLFYSDGGFVWNKNNTIMPNGAGLNGFLSTYHGVFSVKSLSNPKIYFLFYIPLYGNSPIMPQGLYYSVIDMQLNGGLGAIIIGMKNIPIPGGENVAPWMSGTRHSNNRDAWLVVRNVVPNQYLSYKITSTGISNTPVVSPSLVNTTSVYPQNYGGVLKFSQNGKKLITCYINDTIAEYCNFNNETGYVTPLFKILPKYNHEVYNTGTAEFSRNGNILYCLSGLANPTVPNLPSGFLFQYNANFEDSTQFMNSRLTIDSVTTSNWGGLQLGPDGKIYTPLWSVDSIGVIHFPEISGVGCNFQRRSIGLNGNICQNDLPQFIQKYYSYLNVFGTGCQLDSVSFTTDIWPPADTVRWNFGDPASGGSNLSYLAAPSHLFSSPGTYGIELYVRHNDNRTDTTWRTITIYPSPQPFTGPDRTICTGNSVTFDAGFCSGCSYEWKNVSSGVIVGTNQTFTTGATGIYCVNVTNGNGCSGSDTVQLTTTPTPLVTNIPPLIKTICSGESTNIPLTGNVPGIMFHWTATLTSGNISGFMADSGQVINQTLINSGVTAGVVTYHITPKIGDCAGTPVDYAVTVNVGDPVNVSIAASINNVCTGIPVSYNATPTNPGANPVYLWKVNAVSAGLNSAVFTYVPANGDVVQCILTSSNTVCVSNNPATSNSITMVVNPLQPVSVVVSPSASPVCSGTTVTFNAVPTNGGTIPVYQWKVNGVNTGSNLPAYSYTPVNGDAVSCVLTSNANCPTGNPASSLPIYMIVNPLLPVSISISPSANPFCLGNPVTYTAVPVNGGSSPTYQWKVNGTNAGLNNSIFTFTPANGDVVTCVLSSSELCPTGNPALSNSITMVVNTSLPAGLAIAASANPFCPGSPVVFTASPANGGSIPVYQWKVNGLNVGGNSPTYTYSPANGDSVRCVMTSNLNCVTGNPASSAKIIMLGTLAPTVIFTSCFDTLTTVNAKPYKLKGGIPLGGTYSGPGVNSVTGTFTPSLAGIGLKSIVYTYTNVAVCSANKTKTINVQSTAPFTCGNTLTDIRDAKTYPTVQIGTQCWMAANLNYGNQISPSQVQFDNCIAEKYCYNDNPLNCTNNGGLYQWDEMMKYDDTPAGQGLCPPGWHIPTEADWTTLFNFYLGNALAGKPLQDTIITGFKALTSGVFYLNSSWSFNGFATLFWSSTPWNATKGISHGLNVFDYSVSMYPSSRANAFPVRCTRD